MQSAIAPTHHCEIERIFKMPLADAIRYAERIPRDNGVRRFRFIDERAFVKFISILRVVKLPAFKVDASSTTSYYIVHGKDDYGEVVAFFRGNSNPSQSVFIETALRMLGITLKTCSGDYLLDLLKL